MAAPTIITALSEKAIAVTNGCFARPISLPGTWNRIRVGIRASIPHQTGNNLTGTPVFGLGFSEGTTNILGDASTDWFIGAYVYQTATWSSGNQWGPFRIDGLSRQGTTNSFGPGSITENGYMANDLNSWFSHWFVDVYKSSATQTYARVLQLDGVGASSALFQTYIQQLAPAGFATHSEQLLTHVGKATSALNAVSLYWNYPSVPLRVFDIGVAVIA